VENIREAVERISARELDRRVPDPPGLDEVTRLASTMNRMLDRLQGSQDRQRRLVSDASHELRSPVAAIRQHAEVAGAHPDAIPVDELAIAVLAETDRLQGLVEDLLVLARLDEGGGSVTTEVDLDDIVLAEAARLRRMSTIDVDTSGVGAGRVHGSATALERVVRNLTDNAVRYTRGRIVFRLAQTDERVVLSVEDDGLAVSALAPQGDVVRMHLQNRAAERVRAVREKERIARHREHPVHGGERKLAMVDLDQLLGSKFAHPVG
jgi:signal transduction histidine kinase